MSKPLQYVYYTAAGVIECKRTEEQIQEHRAFYAIQRPSEGRPRLAGALYFMIQEMLDKAAEKSWFSIVDNTGHMTTLRPGAIFGFRVLEPLGDMPEEPPIGFRASATTPTSDDGS